MQYSIHYAESAQQDGAQPPQLFAGDTPAVVTQDFELTAAAVWPQFTPLARGVDGGFELWAAGAEIAAVTAFEIPVGTVRKAVYTEGMFNIDAINWPAETTEDEVEAAQTGNLRFRKLLYSDQRTGNEGDPGTPAGPA